MTFVLKWWNNKCLRRKYCAWWPTRVPFYWHGNKQACLIERLEQAENKFPAPCTPALSSFILIHFSAAAGAVTDSKEGKDCSYTKHFSSRKNWFNDNVLCPQSMGQREKCIMKEGRVIMKDHKAIPITLTSTINTALCFIPKVPRPLVEFPSASPVNFSLFLFSHVLSGAEHVLWDASSCWFVPTNSYGQVKLLFPPLDFISNHPHFFSRLPWLFSNIEIWTS